MKGKLKVELALTVIIVFIFSPCRGDAYYG